VERIGFLCLIAIRLCFFGWNFAPHRMRARLPLFSALTPPSKEETPRMPPTTQTPSINTDGTAVCSPTTVMYATKHVCVLALRASVSPAKQAREDKAQQRVVVLLCDFCRPSDDFFRASLPCFYLPRSMCSSISCEIPSGTSSLSSSA
jgi:hypothetical protein